MKKLLFIGLMIAIMIISKGDYWTQKADIPGNPRQSAIGFSNGIKGYVAGGLDSLYHNVAGLVYDCWEYDTLSNTWTQRQYPDTSLLLNVVTFSIGQNVFLALGYDTITNFAKNNLWEFNPINGSWTQKADFPGQLRLNAAGFSIGSKGYLGTGQLSDSVNFGVFKDFWEYDTLLNTWTQKADFGGGPIYMAVGFSIGSKGYFGNGEDSLSNLLNNFWEYDPITDHWNQIANFPGVPRFTTIAFSIGNKGYAGTGCDFTYYYDDFYEYDPNINSWSQKANFGGGLRGNAVGFSIGTKGYLGSGMFYGCAFGGTSDFWQYTPDSLKEGINEITNPLKTTLYPNPFSTQTTLTIEGIQTNSNISLNIYDASGKEVKNISMGDKKQITINRDGLKAGVYFLNINTGNQNIGKKLVVED